MEGFTTIGYGSGNQIGYSIGRYPRRRDYISKPIKDEEWHFFVATFSQNPHANLYLDGKKMAYIHQYYVNSMQIFTGKYNEQIELGTHWERNKKLLLGEMANLKIYDSVLSERAVRMMYHRGMICS
jgi:hypothetical protein